MFKEELIKRSIEAQKYSFSPYSHVCVGAAILTKENKIFTGCNIENASFGATICAERNAIFKAISEGEKEFKAIAITSNLDDFIYPCGICRQVLSEFSPDITIILKSKNNEIKVKTIKELLPNSFTLNEQR